MAPPSCCFPNRLRFTQSSKLLLFPNRLRFTRKKNEEGVGAVAPSSCWFLCFPFHLQPHAPGPPGRLIPLQSFVHARWYPQRVPQSQKTKKTKKRKRPLDIILLLKNKNKKTGRFVSQCAQRDPLPAWVVSSGNP